MHVNEESDEFQLIETEIKNFNDFEREYFENDQGKKYQQTRLNICGLP